MHGSKKGVDGIVWHREHRSPKRRNKKGMMKRMSTYGNRNDKNHVAKRYKQLARPTP